MGQEVIIAPADQERAKPSPPFGSPVGAAPVAAPASDADIRLAFGDRSGGKFASMVGAYREWRNYRQEIPELVLTAEKNLLWIESALNDYRMTIVELSYKLETVDGEVWSLYNEVREEFPLLKNETNRRPLTFRRRVALQGLWNRWNELIAKQEKQLELLSKAPESLRFYNSSQLLNKHLTDERAKRAENVKQVREAREVLEKSLIDLAQNDFQIEPITIGSKILRLEDAHSAWKLKLDNFRAAENTDITDPDDLLVQIQKLSETVKEAPVSARWIRALEAKFSKLVTSHDVLVSLGKNVIPQQDLARATTNLFEVVPKLWLNGQNEELDRNLQSLERFITLNEDAVRREVEFAERRRPGITQALSMGMDSATDGLSSLILLARSMVDAVDSRDRFMRGHSEEVTRLALSTARKMNWKGVDLEYLELAGLLHDVGKLSIPEAILSKTSPLTKEERAIIEKHPTYGADIVKPVKGLGRIIPWIYHHQERWDGAGYPDRISRRDIPLAASIIGVAEAFTVMTSTMPYRQSVSKTDALDTVQQEAGRQFNPEVVEAFVEMVNESSNEKSSSKTGSEKEKEDRK